MITPNDMRQRKAKVVSEKEVNLLCAELENSFDVMVSFGSTGFWPVCWNCAAAVVVALDGLRYANGAFRNWKIEPPVVTEAVQRLREKAEDAGWKITYSGMINTPTLGYVPREWQIAPRELDKTQKI